MLLSRPHALRSTPQARIPPVTPGRAHRWLAVVPTLAVCVGVPFADGVHASVAGLPFLLVWIVGCVLLTSVVMAVIHALDGRSNRP